MVVLPSKTIPLRASATDNKFVHRSRREGRACLALRALQMPAYGDGFLLLPTTVEDVVDERVESFGFDGVLHVRLQHHV